MSQPEILIAARRAAIRFPVVTEPRGTRSVVAWPAAREGAWWRDALLRRLLAVADAAAAALVAATIGATSGLEAATWSALFLPSWIVLAKLHGLYERDQRAMRHLTVDELPRLAAWGASSSAATMLFLMLTPVGALHFVTVVQATLVAAASALVLRGAARALWRRITPAERVVIVGEGRLAAATRRKLQLFPDIHARLVGEDVTVEELRGSPDVLAEVDRIVLASSHIDEDLIGELVPFCRAAHIKLSVVPPGRGMFGTAVQLQHVADLPVVEYNTWDVSRSTLLLKRALDVGLASAALVAVTPLLVLTALAIRIEGRGAILFSQVRAGAGGRPFRMYKFRTMVPDAEEMLRDLLPFDSLEQPMFKLAEDPRVTRLGRLLRRTSIDELPQLVNVLRGDMSLVGPRPEQVELVERYRPEHRFRTSVKPGITGPMQVFGRGALTFEERLSVEREYVENLSIGRDLRILAMTLPAVVRGGGAF